jgi:peptidyl-prolyl cis-trans isomerase B (cyclophilin B)
MKYPILFFLLIIIFSSCDNQPPDGYYSNKSTNQFKIDTIPKKTIKKVIIKTNLLNNHNVKQKLLDFGTKNKENKILIRTEFGNIKIRLYKNTPFHRANFILLAKRKFFDSTIFYRVIRNFMIQGGNSDKDNMLQKMAKIGMYRVPPEINSKNIHKRGALAMAVQEQYCKDPSKINLSSSPYNFYIIQKGPLSDSYMDKIEIKYKIKIPESNRAIYRKIGGSPHLDNEYTVFGEVVSGLSIVDKISEQITNGKNRPLNNIFLSVEVLN